MCHMMFLCNASCFIQFWFINIHFLLKKTELRHSKNEDFLEHVQSSKLDRYAYINSVSNRNSLSSIMHE